MEADQVESRAIKKRNRTLPLAKKVEGKKEKATFYQAELSPNIFLTTFIIFTWTGFDRPFLISATHHLLIFS